jgi:S1-C subfamily serine protease
MDIEELNKFQIILLTLLVSFVTSIATGIVTVSLMDQAPPMLTQTINKVVERTIETVVPQEVPQTASVVTTKETTVVVKEEDLITSSIDKNAGLFAMLYHATTAGPSIGRAFIIAKNGSLVVDRTLLTEEKGYIAEVNGGTYELAVAKVDGVYGLAFLAPISASTTVAITPPKFGSLSNAKRGQTVLDLVNGGRGNVGIGIVSGIETKTVDEQELAFLLAGISGKNPPIGTPLLNIFGEVIGYATTVSQEIDPFAFVPADRIAAFLSESAVTKSESTQLPKENATKIPAPAN